MNNKILIITKNFPPQVWGIEKYVNDLCCQLSQAWDQIKIIAASPRNEKLIVKKWSLFFPKRIAFVLLYQFSELWRLGRFFLYAMTFGLFYGNRVDIIWTMDGSISWIWVILGKIFQKRTRVTIHGTDIVWNRAWYQFVIPKFINKTDEIYVVSESTREACISRHIAPHKIRLVVHTAESLFFPAAWIFDRYQFLLNLWIWSPEKKIILFSIWRWVKRKWFHWFIDTVLPHLDKNNYHYILCWSGSMGMAYRHLIKKYDLSSMVSLLGSVTEQDKARIFLSSSYFIMPNVSVDWDVEWFWLVLLEAQFYWLKCIVSDVDWLGGRVSSRDIVIPSMNPELWVNVLKKLSLTI